MPLTEQKKLKFIGCEIIYREACLLAAKSPHRIDLEFLRKGLHDLETADMVAKLQETIDAAGSEQGYDAILLGYARCNDGTVGLVARDVPLIIPRAHDCVTFFFGSRCAYREYFDKHPGTFYMTTGWCERDSELGEGYDRPAYSQQGVMGHLGLADSHEQLVEKYGRENAEFIAQNLGDWTKNYSKFLYMEMGVCDETPFIEQTKRQAELRSWQFELRKGDWTLLEKFFSCRWDDDFVIVPPGGKITARNDELVLDTSCEGCKGS